jgi:hypothetical protein
MYIYNVSSIHAYEQTNHTMKLTWRKANEGAFTNFINPWNQEDQSIATGFPPPHFNTYIIRPTPKNYQTWASKTQSVWTKEDPIHSTEIKEGESGWFLTRSWREKKPTFKSERAPAEGESAGRGRAPEKGERAGEGREAWRQRVWETLRGRDGERGPDEP